MKRNHSFDLEKALAAWQRTLTYRAALTDEDREELAQHIRDQVETLMLKGFSEEAAYHQAIRQMGHAHTTEAAYWENRSWLQKMTAFRPMLTNYLRLATRNLKKNKVASTINIVGLSIALAVCIMVYLYLRGQWSLDTFHANGDRIFIVEHTREIGNAERRQGWTPAPLGPAVAADMPQVEHAVRVTYQFAEVEKDGNTFRAWLSFADPGFFDMFTFPLKSGSADRLADPLSMVLSEAMAQKYFGTMDPVGQSLTFSFTDDIQETFQVVGVAEPFPSNAGFGFAFLANLTHLERLGLKTLDAWDTSVSATFLQLHTPADANVVTEQLERYVPLQQAAALERPIKTFYLDNLLDPVPGGHTVIRRFLNRPHPMTILGFIGLAAFMLALSCFNYVNIALGSAARRLKEIGMRKVMGGRRLDLILQFLAENVVMCLLALVLGVFIAQFVLIPATRLIPDIPSDLFVFSWADGTEFYVFLAVLLVVVGLISGAYPAFYVSAFSPTVVFRGKQKFANKKGLTYTFLSIQFVLTFLTVMLGTLGSSLNNYLASLDWGYNHEETVLVRLTGEEHYARFRDAVAEHPRVVHIEGAIDPVGQTAMRANVQVEEAIFRPLRYRVGPTYLAGLGFRLKEGRFFDDRVHGTVEQGVVVNETFVSNRRWTEPLGQVIQVEGTPHTVIGVIEDFNERGPASLFLEEGTVFLRSDTGPYTYASIQLQAGHTQETLHTLEASWAQLFPEIPFEYLHQSAVFDRDMGQFMLMIQMLYVLSGVALLIACMGLFGLSAQNSARRLKEVGIRKTLGASTAHLILKVNRSFVLLLTLAGGVATLIVYTAIEMGEAKLGIDLPFGPAPFLIAFVFVLGTAALAVASQTYRLVRTNPADVLRNE